MDELLKQISQALNWVNVVTALAVAAGGWVAWKKSLANASEEIYKRVVTAYKTEVQELQGRMRLLEEENARLHRLLDTIKRSLARRGLRVTDEGEVERKGPGDGDGGR
jgi:hypothetical protein